jgi:hypothetical protein
MTNSTPAAAASSQDSHRGPATPEGADKARPGSGPNSGGSGRTVPGTITDVGPKIETDTGKP